MGTRPHTFCIALEGRSRVTRIGAAARTSPVESTLSLQLCDTIALRGLRTRIADSSRPDSSSAPLARRSRFMEASRCDLLPFRSRSAAVLQCAVSDYTHTHASTTMVSLQHPAVSLCAMSDQPADITVTHRRYPAGAQGLPAQVSFRATQRGERRAHRQD
ncbi:hypothetical protein DAEQUDRAFT_124770 [Daedalea quercina L-15889]|uniref:Uncharacterized protein n=1 Tax=Daedalea quercina L-15889 TaxID=1314783 RepID=A0A165RYL5_9APHY|nr:hypothetical protein DAEQUDRAFT_124770 [Daedalea quercina L-15889]